MSNIQNLKKELRALGSKEKALQSQRFFKTGKGQYGEGDIFLGINVPNQRKIAQKYQNLPLKALQDLLSAKEHEFRLTALYILVMQYQKGDRATHDALATFYLSQAQRINNWDLVDASAHSILGHYLLTYKTPKQTQILLTKLAKSATLWERRIAVVSSWAFIKAGHPETIFSLTQLLLKDSEDLMHKAVGWMLREVGKHCGQNTLSEFLDEYATQLPRTTLRYALEHYPEKKRKSYMYRK